MKYVPVDNFTQTVISFCLSRVSFPSERRKPVSIEGLCERTEYIDIFLFSAITQSCSVSDVLFTGGRGVSDFSVLKYY